MQANSLCRYLEWDSDFWGRRMARADANCLDRKSVREMREWCEDEAIDCLYFLADADEEATVRLAEENGFRLADIRLTLERGLKGISPAASEPGPPRIRPCVPEDVPALRSIARLSHRDSRFYFDSNFPRALCNRLYEVWIEKSCRGYADGVLVAEHEGLAAGYVSCHLSKEATNSSDGLRGDIGLVGVGASAQGRGLGLSLVEGALGWFAAQGMERVSVVTQGRNVRAQRLYQKCGFKTQSVRLWYHLWFPRTEPISRA